MKKLMLALAFMLSTFAAFAEEDWDSEAVIAPAAKEVTISTFYDALTPYGSWVQDEKLGWVWQPKEVADDTDWRPYCHGGHWVWTDAGWYWESSYKWGWAAFHYGRWSRHATLNWVWVPDCNWGPAWVTFRDCDDAFGWAPLPPGCSFDVSVGQLSFGGHFGFEFDFGFGVDDFCFVPCGSFFEVNLWKHHCHHDACVKFWGHTKICCKYEFRNHVCCNHGFERARIEKHCGKFEEIRIRNASVRSGERIVGEHRTAAGIEVYRPRVRDERPVGPKEVRERREEHARAIQHAREEHREVRQERREEKHEAAQERHEERKEVRQERHERQEQHQEQRHEQHEQRQEQHHEQRPEPHHEVHQQRSEPPAQHHR